MVLHCFSSFNLLAYHQHLLSHEFYWHEIQSHYILLSVDHLVYTATAQIKSPKRGIGWDEKTQKLSNAPIDKLLPGVSWIYTWGENPQGVADNLGNEDGIMFIPMAWGRNFNETSIRNYIKEHSSVKYLLGFNEPNFAAQANMTPAEAASLWRVLEGIASEFDLRLVAPALNFSGENLPHTLLNQL